MLLSKRFNSDRKGVANISDDIIVHWKTTEGHDERLKRVWRN